MKRSFDFNDLYVFDLANNHQGRLEHGLAIVREVANVAAKHKVRGAIKLQFRQLDTFIHPAYRQGEGNKHIRRFLSTRLSGEAFRVLVDEVRRQGLIPMCTPFDEPSLDVIEELAIEVVKVGSCSATDWPLLEEVAQCNKPVIFSTGGLTGKEIDDVVSFFDHRRVPHAIMHCVSLYPTPLERLELNQIEFLRRRYPDKVIGFSTHENPEDLSPVQIAVAKGARIFERHVGIATSDITLNAYSSTPEHIDRWIAASLKAKALCGGEQRRPWPWSGEELAELAMLKRGVYAKQALKTGTVMERDDVYFAMPHTNGQLSSSEWKSGIVATTEISTDAALMVSELEIPHDPEAQILYTSIHTIKGMLNEARIALNTDFDAEFSHHYGIKRFPEAGATIINCVNRGYCKKLVILMPGQRHPSHFHKKKEETFQVLHGILELEVEGRRRTLAPGDTQLIPQGVWHEFWTERGVIFEEISTTHFNDDSFYEDKAINRLERSARKTVVSNWGRYQIGVDKPLSPMAGLATEESSDTETVRTPQKEIPSWV